MVRSIPCSASWTGDPGCKSCCLDLRGPPSEKLFQLQHVAMWHSELLQSSGAASSSTSRNRTSTSLAASSSKFVSRPRELRRGFESSRSSLDGRELTRSRGGLKEGRRRTVMGASGDDDGVGSPKEGDLNVTQVLKTVVREHRGIRAEDVVKVQIEKLGNNSRKVVAKIIIEAPLDNVWAILTDYEHLADFIPGLAVNELLEKRHNGARLYQVGEQNVALEVKFKAKAAVDCKEKPTAIHEDYIRRDIDFENVERGFEIFRGTWRMEQPVNPKPCLTRWWRWGRNRHHSILHPCRPTDDLATCRSSRRAVNE